MLEDEEHVLNGRHLVCYDVVYPKIPSKLDAVLTQCLNIARAGGARTAWFGFEGSFDFSMILTSDIADQIYAVLDQGEISIATDDTIQTKAWAETVERARKHMMSVA